MLPLFPILQLLSNLIQAFGITEMRGNEGAASLPNFPVPEVAVVPQPSASPQVLPVAGLRSPGTPCRGKLASMDPLPYPCSKDRSPRASELGEGK